MCINLAIYGGIYTRPMTWRRIKKRGKLNQPMAAKEEEINRPATKWATLRTGRTLGLNAEKRMKHSDSGYDTYGSAEEEI